MKKISTNQIRHNWLHFFESKGHLILPSQSLIPINDRSLLWINSGVATLKPYFSGEKNPPAKRLTNSQKSIRTNDIENVGITSRHHTFFEMLGNFSIGDYFKKEAINFAYELLTKVFEMDINNIYITVFNKDDDAYQYWLDLKIKPDHIIKCDRDRNFWDVGQGPCGPCSEIYYDRGTKYDPKNIGIDLFKKDIENDRFVEIWNIVFSQFNNDGSNNYSELSRKNIDTGAGLERLACIIQDVPTNFDTDLFKPIIEAISTLTDCKYDQDNYFEPKPEQTKINYSYRIIADHIKSCVFAIADGAIPSNKDRGYVLRRLIRRSMVFANKIKIKSSFVSIVANSVIESMKEYYPYLIQHKQKIIDCLIAEENQFIKTLTIGYQLFEKLVNKKIIDGDIAFKLMDTYGFPIELIKELAMEKNLQIDLNAFNEKLLKHQEISKQQNNIKAMTKQNADLINFTLESKFDYDAYDVKPKVIGIFDSDLKQIDAINKNGIYWLVFDSTTLYANSGGQIADVGTIIINNIEYNVMDVIKGPNLQHFHQIDVVNNEIIKISAIASIHTDKQKRKIIKAHHSSEHLIHKALKTLIDSNIKQEGAFKSHEKVTFDFAFSQKLSNEQLNDIETLINKWIHTQANVDVYNKTLDEAKAMNALAYFEDVYNKIKGKLRVVKMGDISTEICGGTHVSNLKDIEQFHITKLTSNGSGSWRIEAIATDYNTQNYINNKYKTFNYKIAQIKEQMKQNELIDQSINVLLNNIKFDNSFDSIQIIEQKLSEIDQKVFQALSLQKTKNDTNEILTLTNQIKNDLLAKNNSIYITTELKSFNTKNIIAAYTSIIKNIQDKCFIGYFANQQKIVYLIIQNDSNKLTNAQEIIKQLNKLTQGSGGGKTNFAQGGCINTTDNLNIIKNYLNNLN